MGFGSKWSILNGQLIYIEKSKLNIADMWLIPLDRVTYVYVYVYVHLVNLEYESVIIHLSSIDWNY